MITLAFVFLAQTGAEPASVYAAQVQSALAATSLTFLKSPGVLPSMPAIPAATTLEVELGTDGSARVVRLAASSGQNKVDDAARAWLMLAEPLPAPDAAFVGERPAAS